MLNMKKKWKKKGAKYISEASRVGLKSRSVRFKIVFSLPHIVSSRRTDVRRMMKSLVWDNFSCKMLKGHSCGVANKSFENRPIAQESGLYRRQKFEGPWHMGNYSSHGNPLSWSSTIGFMRRECLWHFWNVSTFLYICK